MRLSELQQLETGQELVHNRYGVCVLVEVTYACGRFFGAIIRPKTEEGQTQLMLDSRTTITDFLENSLRRLTR